MKQYVLTRSAYGPAWDIAANTRRLAVTKAGTARMMAAQTTTDWTWVVALDERDPLLKDRLALYADSAPAFCPIVFRTTDDRTRHSAPRQRQRAAAADYAAPWRRDIPSDETVLMARLDDDDGFAPDALARTRKRAEGITTRTALMLPVGVHVWHGRYAIVRHERNAMHTLLTPPGDTWSVYSYGHTRVRDLFPVVTVDEEPGWLWVRHLDTISNARNPRQWSSQRPALLSREIRALFPIDWQAIA